MTAATAAVAPAPAPQPLPLTGDGPAAWLAALVALARKAGWAEAIARQSLSLARAIDAAVRDLHHPADRARLGGVGDAGALLQSWTRWAAEAPRAAWAALRRAARRVGEWAQRARQDAAQMVGAPAAALRRLAEDAERWAGWVAAGVARGVEDAYREAGRGVGTALALVGLGLALAMASRDGG